MEINTPIQKPKEGHWKEQKVGNMTVQICDQCGFCFPLIRIGGYFNYCPDCGSIMNKDKDERVLK